MNDHKLSSEVLTVDVSAGDENISSVDLVLFYNDGRLAAAAIDKQLIPVSVAELLIGARLPDQVAQG